MLISVFALTVVILRCYIHVLVDTFDQFKTCLKTRKELVRWMQEALDLLDSVERTRRLSTTGCPQVLSAQLRKLEEVSTEVDHYEGLLNNLKTTYTNLRQSLEDSARETDRYRLSIADLPCASPDVRNICPVGPPGSGLADLVALDSSLYNVDATFAALKDRLAAHMRAAITTNLISATFESAQVTCSYVIRQGSASWECILPRNLDSEPTKRPKVEDALVVPLKSVAADAANNQSNELLPEIDMGDSEENFGFSLHLPSTRT
ncbi:unnamed protein product, partial [Dibothriocephalus latus]